MLNDTELAIAIVNLRMTLEKANEMLKKAGCFQLSCDESERPTFRDSATFYKEVRKTLKGTP